MQKTSKSFISNGPLLRPPLRAPPPWRGRRMARLAPQSRSSSDFRGAGPHHDGQGSRAQRRARLRRARNDAARQRRAPGGRGRALRRSGGAARHRPSGHVGLELVRVPHRGVLPLVALLSGGHRHGTHSFFGIAVFTAGPDFAGLYQLSGPKVTGLGHPAFSWHLVPAILFMSLLYSAALRALHVGGHHGDLLGIGAAIVTCYTGADLTRLPVGSWHVPMLAIAVALGCAAHIAGDELTHGGCPSSGRPACTSSTCCRGRCSSPRPSCARPGSSPAAGGRARPRGLARHGPSAGAAVIAHCGGAPLAGLDPDVLPDGVVAVGYDVGQAVIRVGGQRLREDRVDRPGWSGS